MTRIVVVANPKGGTCKSTTVTNLCSASSQAGYKTLLIDLDHQGSSSILSGLNVDEIHEDRTASRMFRPMPDKPTTLCMPSPHGFDVVPAGAQLVSSSDWLSSINFGDHHLSDLLRDDSDLNQYDFVFIDTAGNKDRLLTAALLASTDLLVPLTPSVLTTSELSGFLELAEAAQKLQKKIHVPVLNILGVVVVRAKERTRTVQDLLSEMGEISSQGIVHMINTVIPDSDMVEKAARARVPVVNFRSGSNVGQRYTDLFNELFGRNPKTKQQSA